VRWLTTLLVVGCVARGAAAAPAATPPGAPRDAIPQAIVDALGSEDVRQVERAAWAITQLPADHADPDTLFAAGRACEDKLLDPGQAVAIYERVVAEHPGARVATAAAHRVTVLRALVGPHGESAGYAAELARLIAHADREPAANVVRRAEQLAAAAWPGAPAAALWLADWLRRSGRLAEAQAYYAVVTARWPASLEARAALRGGAGCALEAHAWSLAEALANRLPTADAVDRSARDDLLAAAARGRRRDRWYAAAWLAIAGALAALLGSLGEAVRNSPAGTRWAALRPPIEIVFSGPIAGVLLGVAFTAHRAIAPAVALIAGGGVALAWLSGATLEKLRAQGRSRRLRSAAHLIACLAGIAGLGYVALIHGGLLDLLVETVRFGPEGS
jgi:hypothetical protein